MAVSEIVRSIALFVLAGLCEIGGGYLVWLWLRDRQSVWLGALGGLDLERMVMQERGVRQATARPHARDVTAPGRERAQHDQRIPAVVPAADRRRDRALRKQASQHERRAPARVLHEYALRHALPLARGKVRGRRFRCRE